MTIEIPEIFLWIFLGLTAISCTLRVIEMYYRQKAKEAAEDYIIAAMRLKELKKQFDKRLN